MPEPIKTTPVYVSGYDDPFRVWVGVTDWQLFSSDKTDAYFQLGASYDFVRFGNHLEAGVYFDSAGWMDKSPSYEYYGGGIELRGYLDSLHSHRLNPYASVGYGVYYNQIEERFRDSSLTLAPRAAVGLEYQRRYFLEGTYTGFGDHFGRDLGRFGVGIGIRF
jgi:hypothetical protein